MTWQTVSLKSIIVIQSLLIILIVTSNVQQDSTKQQKLYRINQQRDSHIVETVYFIFDKQCYDQYFSKLSFAASGQCYAYTLSKILGYMLVVTSIFIRVPQILIILKQKSVAGLSFFGNNQQLLMTSLNIGFSIYTKVPFSVYGDNCFIGTQNFIILLLFLKFTKDKEKLGKMIFQFLLICFISAASIFQLFPPQAMQASVWLLLVTFILARGSQIITNFINKSTGNLAFVSIFLLFCGCLIRVFNILVQASDEIGLLMNNLIPAIMNGYILLQFWLYKGNKVKDQ